MWTSYTTNLLHYAIVLRLWRSYSLCSICCCKHCISKKIYFTFTTKTFLKQIFSLTKSALSKWWSWWTTLYTRLAVFLGKLAKEKTLVAIPMLQQLCTSKQPNVVPVHAAINKPIIKVQYKTPKILLAFLFEFWHKTKTKVEGCIRRLGCFVSISASKPMQWAGLWRKQIWSKAVW